MVIETYILFIIYGKANTSESVHVHSSTKTKGKEDTNLLLAITQLLVEASDTKSRGHGIYSRVKMNFSKMKVFFLREEEDYEKRRVHFLTERFVSLLLIDVQQ